MARATRGSARSGHYSLAAGSSVLRGRRGRAADFLAGLATCSGGSAAGAGWRAAGTGSGTGCAGDSRETPGAAVVEDREAGFRASFRLSGTAFSWLADGVGAGGTRAVSGAVCGAASGTVWGADPGTIWGAASEAVCGADSGAVSGVAFLAGLRAPRPPRRVGLAAGSSLSAIVAASAPAGVG